MGENVTCPLCGETREIYDAYRYDPWFKQKVDLIAQMEGVEQQKVLSTKMWELPVPDGLLGL